MKIYILSAIAGLALGAAAIAFHTVILQQLCWNGFIDDSTAETIGAFMDGDL